MPSFFFFLFYCGQISRETHDGELEILRCQSGRFLKLLAPSSRTLLPGRSRPAVNGYGWRATAPNGHWLLVCHSPIDHAISPRAAVRPLLHLTSSWHCSVMECFKAHRRLTLPSLRTIPVKAMVSQEMVQDTEINHRLLILRALFEGTQINRNRYDDAPRNALRVHRILVPQA